MGPRASLLALLFTCIISHAIAVEDLYWEGEEDVSNEFLEVKDENESFMTPHIRRIRGLFDGWGDVFFTGGSTSTSTTTTPAPENLADDEDDAYDVGPKEEEDETGSGSLPVERDSENREMTIRVSFVAIEPYQDEYSNRDSEQFRALSHTLAESVNSLYDTLPGTQRASLVRIQSRISDNFSCKVTLDIVTTGYYDKDRITSILRDHIRSNRALGTVGVNDSDFSARSIDSENGPDLLPECALDEVSCDNGQCVPGNVRCDGTNDCSDGSDELNCPVRNERPDVGCAIDQLQCSDGKCISSDARCNRIYDCRDGSDERDCPGDDELWTSQTDEPTETSTNAYYEGFHRTIAPDRSQPDDSDSSPRSRGLNCDESIFCNNNLEICADKRCDGIQDCSQGEDEQDCPGIRPPVNGECMPDELSCDNTRCVPQSTVCDGRRDCDDGADEQNCPPITCGEDDFRCNNGKCIEGRRRCDRVIDCGDGEDEQNCECNPSEYRCESDGSCIEKRKLCDGIRNCADGSDERNCGSATCPLDSFDCGGGECISALDRCNNVRDCPNGEDEEGCEDDCLDKCSDGRCIEASMLCNGVPDCPDASDELHCSDCEDPTDFRCTDGECINSILQCNGLRDCTDGSDELNCNTTIILPSQRCRDNEFTCSDGSCINDHFVCDDRVDCVDGSDEKNCPCPDDKWKCKSGQCVDSSAVCNGVVDCIDSSDEGPFCPTTTVAPEIAGAPGVDENYPRSPYYTTTNRPVLVYTTHLPTGPLYNEGPVSLQLRTYPNEQTVRHTETGGDVVFQCRDEGPKRAPVRWVREGGRPLARGSTDRNGRLEMYKVTSADSGVYICQATAYLGYPGSELRVTLNVQNPPATPAPPPASCRREEATCGNGQCIPKTAVCDGKRDCADNSDEDSCNENGRCEPNQFQCRNRRCVLKTWLCDSEDDCGDGSDEENCGATVPGQPCSPVEYQCTRDNQCIPKSFHCDGMNDCLDGTDEIGCIPVYVSKPPQPSKVTLYPGETLTLRCKAVGVPVPLIVWRLNWGHVPDKCQSTSVNGEGTLMCENMQPPDRGAYSCEAINNKGTDFAIPDAIVDVYGSPNQNVCRAGYFNSEARTESECIRCFCFGAIADCKSADLFTYHMPTPLGHGGTRLVGATINPSGVNIESQPITDEYYYQPLRNGATVTKLNTYNTNSRAIPYLALPESYNGNQLTSYGGRIKYKLQPHSTGFSYSTQDLQTPDIIIKGQFGLLMHSFRKERAPLPEIYVETKLVPENWRRPSPRGAVLVTREEIMMALDNIEMILVRANLNGAGVNISEFAMESAQHINTGLGAASLVEECKCPPGYEGLSCQKCAAGYVRESSGPWLGRCRREKINCPAGTYGDPASGIPCRPCPCPLTNRENQFARTCSLGADGEVVCDCMTGYEGRHCEYCAPGYIGNPIMPGDACRPKPTSNCDPIGTRNVRLPDQCECKNHVTGRYCDQCKEGSFFLSPDFRHGCAQCFCSGVTQQCSSSNFRRRTTSISFNSPQSYSQVKIYNSTSSSSLGPARYTVPLETNIDPMRATGPIGGNTPTIYYWSLPHSFAGDKVTSYGGKLEYTIRSVPAPGSSNERNSAPDVQLISENRLTFHYFGEDLRPSSDGTLTVSVPFLEAKWLRPDGTEVQRQYLLLALADVKAILVKTSFSENAAISYLISASIETAEVGGNGPVALHVEQCDCPQGYLGTSCEDCAPGYKRGGDGFYLQHCERCECNGHSNDCHPETGECHNCADNTAGPHCELCRPGFEKDSNGNCVPSRPSANCNCDPRGQEMCDNGQCICKVNVEGAYCDRCRQGTFGLDTTNPDGCTPCYCSGLGVECNEATHYSRVPVPAPILGSDYGGYTLMDLSASKVINDHFVPVTNESELQYVFPFPPDDELYWSLPVFPGNKVLSYGGALSLTQKFESDGYAQYSTPGNDVVLVGDDTTIYWTNPQQMRSGVPLSYKVPLRENGWRVLETGQEVDRNVFMTVLSNLKRVLVIATPSTEIHSIAIADVSMDVATNSFDSGVPAKDVELCMCPPGYTGTSCETCASDYYRDLNGRCTICPCNRHKCQLDASGEVVCNCLPPYTGRDCSTVEREPSPNNTYPPRPPTPSVLVVKITGPTIRIQDIGGSVNFTCLAQSRNSRPLAVTWRKADGYLPLDRSYTDDVTGTLVITNLQRTDSGIYICQANDGIATGQAMATLQVPGNQMTAPDVTVTPAYKDYYEGDRIELQCKATGNPTPTITWQRVGTQRTLSLAAVRYDTYFVIESARLEDSGEYSCVASNAAGSSDRTAVINVRPRPSWPNRDQLSISPSSPNVVEGQSTRVVCTGTANVPPDSIGWIRQDGTEVLQNVRSDNGILYIDVAQLENQGVYVCQTSSGDVNPVSVLVTVTAVKPLPPSERPNITVSADQLTIPTGGNGMIDCEPHGNPLPLVKWTKHTGEFGEGVSQRGKTLIITNAQQSDEGYYMCEGTNPQDGSRIGNIYVMVLIERREPPRVSIWPPGEQAVHLYSEFEFVCQVTGGVPEPVVTWSRTSGRPLSAHTDIASGNRLKFSNITVNDEGQYVCSASNIAGEATATAELKVRLRPQITLKPSSNIEVNRGDPVNIECRANGYPEPLVSIRQDTPEYRVITPPSPGIATLRIYSAGERDDGTYSCVATSDAGTLEEPFRVLVERGDIGFGGGNEIGSGSEPEVQNGNDGLRPRTREFVAVDGQTTRITCADTSDAFDVRWNRLDGRPLQRNAEQRNNDLIIHEASSRDAGDYECTIIDRYTNAPREAYIASLAIVRLPRITLNPATQTVRPGQSPTVDCIVDGDDIVQIRWQPTTRPFSNRVEVRESKLIFHEIEVEDAGQYVCFVESRLGNASGTAEVVVNGPRANEPSAVSIVKPTRPFMVGDSVEVLCKARSREFRVQWERVDNKQYVESRIFGDGAMLIIPSVQEADAGVYRCIGEDPYRRSYSDEFTLEVIPTDMMLTTMFYEPTDTESPGYWATSTQPPVTQGPQQPLNEEDVIYTARLNDSVNMPCTHNLEQPASVEWRREYLSFPSEVRTNEPTLHLQRVTEKDAGTYVCRVSNNRAAIEVRAVLRVTHVVPRFDGYGWLSLPPLKDPYRQFEIEVAFNPMSGDGLILYNSEKQGREGDYMALELVSGVPQFTMEFGDGPLVVKGNRPLQLNTWHTIRISRINTRVTMDVDNTGPITANAPSDSRWLVFELNEPMYIGGVPDYAQLPISATGYVGCVSMLILGREEKNIMEELWDQENVGECDTCSPNPCLNNGVCQEARNPRGFLCICPNGFAGLDCARTDDACRPGLCGPGRCLDTPEGFKCSCPITYTGKRCEIRQNIEYPAFSGSGYLAINTPRMSRVFHMNMKIKAAAPVSDGIIMYCAESARGPGKFMSLAVKDGRLEFRLDLGDPSGPFILRSTNPIRAEEWTEVYISKFADTISMKVDMVDDVNALLPSSNTELLWETPMFVGGYDDSIILNKDTGVTGGFSGCIKDVALLGQSIDIVNTSIQSANVQECSKFERGDVPEQETGLSQVETICSQCRNGGYCTSPESTTCTCPPGYTGVYCEARTSYRPMRQPNAGNPCAARPCRNEGVCKADAYNRNYTCDCPLGFAGVNCQMHLELRESVGFNGNGYLELPANLLRHERSADESVIIALLVHTIGDGVLLYQRETLAPIGKGDFILLKIQDGFVNLEWDMGSGVTSITVDKVFVADGQMHQIIAEFRDSGVMLTVNSQTEYSNSIGFSSVMNADSNVYIGGIPESLNYNNLPGLVGCIQQIELMNMDRGILLGAVAVAGRNTQRCREFSTAVLSG